LHIIKITLSLGRHCVGGLITTPLMKPTQLDVLFC
jgi:hypothetical protein